VDADGLEGGRCGEEVDVLDQGRVLERDRQGEAGRGGGEVVVDAGGVGQAVAEADCGGAARLGRVAADAKRVVAVEVLDEQVALVGGGADSQRA